MTYNRNPRKWNAETEDAILLRLHAQGMRDTEIAERMKRSKNFICKRRLMLELGPNKSKNPMVKENDYTPIQVARIVGTKPNPYKVAEAVLGARLKIRKLRDQTVYVLDGKIGATIQQIIAATNQCLTTN